MNRHFGDAWYYAKRAWMHLRAGVADELSRVGGRVRAELGREPAPEPSRVERAKAGFQRLEARVQREGKQVVASTRERF